MAMAGEEWVKVGETPIEFAAENPHQKDSKIFHKYEGVKKAGSVAEAKTMGAKAWDLVDWHKRGYLRVAVKAGVEVEEARGGGEGGGGDRTGGRAKGGSGKTGGAEAVGKGG
eukprot:4149591-Karenia_brevis.AAC.1